MQEHHVTSEWKQPKSNGEETLRTEIKGTIQYGKIDRNNVFVNVVFSSAKETAQAKLSLNELDSLRDFIDQSLDILTGA